MPIESMLDQEFPLVSILAIAYNHEQFVLNALDSVLAQDYPNIELIIMDAASSDATADLIKNWVIGKDFPIKTVFQSSTKTITQNANEGLEIISGKYFQILSCDDVLENDKISKQVEVFNNSDDRLAVVYCDAIKIDDSGELISEPSFFEERSWFSDSQIPSGCIFPLLLQDYHIVAPTVLVDTQKVRDQGGYNPKSMMEDLDIFLRLAQEFSFKGIAYKGVKYRVLETSLIRSSSVKKRQMNRLILYKNFVGQKGEWDRYIAHQFILAKKSGSFFYKFLFNFKKLILKGILSKVKKINFE
jgi:glycosyltransferase involved in cell wall biosynthesis